MFENIVNFFKNIGKKEDKKQSQENSKDAAKERLHLVLMQDRANVSADVLDLMKQEIIEVIKKYIDIDESAMDVRLTNKENKTKTSMEKETSKQEESKQEEIQNVEKAEETKISEET